MDNKNHMGFYTFIQKLVTEVVVKGGYLDFSHLTELKNTYITEIYMKKKQYKSSIIMNHNIYITKKNFLMVCPKRLRSYF